MPMTIRFAVLWLLFLLAAVPAVAQTPPPAGTWAALLNSVLYPVMPPEAKSASAPGGTPELWSPFAIMSAWSGGDVAQINGIWGFVIWGGGHADGPDNSLYFIPFDGSGPRALMGPYLPPIGMLPTAAFRDSQGEAYPGVSRNQTSTLSPGQAPKSRHTYSSILALRDRKQVWASGGALTSGSGGGGIATWTFDLAQTYTQAMARPDMGWARKADALEHSVARSSGYDEKNRVVISRGATYWGRYDPDANRWTKIGNASGGSDYVCSVAMDSPGRKMWVLCGARLGEVINLDTYAVTRFLTGSCDGCPPAPVVQPGYEWALALGPYGPPGVAWHPGRKRLIAWKDGQNLLSIDPQANTVTPLTMTGALVTPPTSTGTFGRFRLIPGTDTVAVVNGVDQPVFLGTLPLAGGLEPAPIPTPLPVPTPVPVTPPLPPGGLTAGVFKSLPLPTGQQGIASASKHVAGAVHPPSGRIYFQGGDYIGTTASNSQSYRQETWSLDLAARLAAGDRPEVGWLLEYPYCGYGGTSVQPKHPDYVGWVWRDFDKRFYMVPGVMDVISQQDCANETTDKADNPNFKHDHVMSFDPLAAPASRWRDEGRDIGAYAQDTWHSVIDQTTDTLYRWASASKLVIEARNMKTGVWRRVIYGTLNALGQDISAGKGHLALDPVKRHVYGIDTWRKRLHRHRLAENVVDDLGPLPGPGGLFPWGVEDGTTWGPVVWNSAAQVVLWYRNDTFQLFAYRPATATWETLITPTEPAGMGMPTVRTMIYHPGLDLTVMLDQNAAQMFVYRYASSGSADKGRKLLK